MSTDDRLALLVPPPARASSNGDSWCPPPRLALQHGAGAQLADSPAIDHLTRVFLERGVVLDSSGERALRLELREGLAPEAYRLRVSSSGVEVEAGSTDGLRHGLRTLTQWVALHADRQEVAGLVVEDEPSFAERGVMLDVARDRRPDLPTLFTLVERLASLKYNRLQLYMEADFAYSFGADALADRSPYLPDELRALDAHCAAHGIELVPNQQCFGHMHHWLRHETWRGLAEVPSGIEHPFSRHIEPFSLCPTDPASREFLARLLDELLPCFRSRTFNAGLDETMDLGQGRSASACEARGKHNVYLEFLSEVSELARARGCRMQFWGDIILERPELCSELPADAIAMDWGYEADHPFERELAALQQSGREFHVCPGTSSWNSFVGRVPNALGNLHSAAHHGQRHGARGLLVTDWGDRGHLQPAPFSAPGFVAGAALSWNADAKVETGALASWLDAWWFQDRGGVVGSAVLELGRLQELTGDRCKNGNAPFFLAIRPFEGLDDPHYEGLSAAGLEAAAAHLEGALRSLYRAELGGDEADLLPRELELGRDLAALGVALGRARVEVGRGPLSEVPRGVRLGLHETLLDLIERHRALWPQRHRPGGLEASSSWLEALATELFA